MVKLSLKLPLTPHAPLGVVHQVVVISAGDALVQSEAHVQGFVLGGLHELSHAVRAA